MVSPASTTLTTTPSVTSETVGGATLKDTAHLSGGFNPTGTITFTLSNPSNTVVDTETVTVTGNGDYATPVGFVPVTAGIYQWNAVYSGDSNNIAASDINAPNEQVTSSSASPTISTTVSPSTVKLTTTAGSATDTATLSAGFSPTGTLTFTVYSDASCSIVVHTSASVMVAGNGVYTSDSFTPATAGTYSWVATYSGDSNNNALITPCGAPGETLTAIRASTTTNTAVINDATGLPTSGSETAGASFHDTATVTGASTGPSPTGTVTYSYFTNSACSGSGIAQTVTLSGGSLPASSSTGALGAGQYSYYAAYSGDTNYFSSVSQCEPFAVQRATVSISTTVNPSTTPALGASVSGTATATGVTGFPPTGTVTMTLYPGGSCAGAPIVTQTSVALGTPSTPQTTLGSGTYSFGSAHYSGDGNYASGTSGSCASFTVQKGTATISTTVSPSTTPALGAPVSDTATATGVSGFTPTGTVTVALYSGSSCSGSPLNSQTLVPLGVSSSALTTLNAGPYSFQASHYSGDTNYLSGASSSCEPFSVPKSPSSTLVACSPNPVTISLTTVCKATVTGYNPGGSVTFSSSSSTGIFSPASGQCTLSAGSCSVSYSDTTAGTPPIKASYGGDANNLVSSGSTILTVSYKDCSSLVSSKGGGNLKGANLEFCNLAGYDLSGDNLMGANMQYTNLHNANLQGANLKGVNLAYSFATGANFQGTNMMGDSLHGGNFMNANFQGANMKSTDLSYGNFSHVNFQGVNLMDSNMSYGDFDYANFTGANTNGVNTTGATFVGATNPP